MEIVGSSSRTSSLCDVCLKGNQSHAEIQKAIESRAAEVLGRVISDVCGPLPIRSHLDWRHVVQSLCGGYVGKIRGLQPLEGLGHSCRARNVQELLCTDGGGEYVANTVQMYLKEKDIQHELTIPDTPQHNGVAERMKRTLLDKVQSMLQDASLPESYWYDAL